MKKSLIALAVLGAFAGSAMAQSSVTLFGIADLNVRHVDNDSAGSETSLSQDGNASSRLGFRGVEDIGGGLKAGFWLEGGVSLDTGGTGGSNGQTSVFFNRRSTVSLLGGFGEIRLGRDYTPTFWNHTVFDPFGTNGVGAQTNIQSTGTTAITLVRANNTIGYFLPAGLGGLYGQVQYAMGEDKIGGTKNNEYWGARVGWQGGPVNVAFAYGETDTLADTLKAWNIGASYNAGFATFMAQYHQYKAADKQTNWLVGANVPVGPGTFKVSYSVADDLREATQIAVGYVYDLSKRTALYAHYAQVDNDGTLARFTASGSGPAGIGAGEKSTGYEFGIRHSF